MVYSLRCPVTHASDTGFLCNEARDALHCTIGRMVQGQASLINWFSCQKSSSILESVKEIAAICWE